MAKVLKEKFKKRMLVVERGVKVADLKDPAFSFILDTFRDRGWLSLFQPVNAYLKLVREFYTNIDKYDPSILYNLGVRRQNPCHCRTTFRSDSHPT